MTDVLPRVELIARGTKRKQRKLEDAPSTKRARRIKKKTPTRQELLFRAGIYSERDVEGYQLLFGIVPYGCLALAGFLAAIDTTLMVACLPAAFLLGMLLPDLILKRRVRNRNEEISSGLPFTCEQLAICTSGGLGMAQALESIVTTAELRENESPIIDLLRLVLLLAKSGTSLPDALLEVGTLQGHHELRHTLLAISEAARHGCRLTPRLRGLADSVQLGRECAIVQKIKTLELKATAAVALAGTGFLITIAAGTLLRACQAFVA